MDEKEIDALIKRIPEIADAVNKFSSEDLQKQAFSLFVEKMGMKSPSPVTQVVTEHDKTAKNDPQSSGSTSAIKTKSKTRAKKIYSADKSLDLRPEGKTSFKDFVQVKLPTNNIDRVTVAVYYLKEELGMAQVSVSHILACFVDANWRMPSDPVNAVQQAGSKTLLNSADSEDVQLTPRGINLVKHDLPRSQP